MLVDRNSRIDALGYRSKVIRNHEWIPVTQQPSYVAQLDCGVFAIAIDEDRDAFCRNPDFIPNDLIEARGVAHTRHRLLHHDDDAVDAFEGRRAQRVEVTRHVEDEPLAADLQYVEHVREP